MMFQEMYNTLVIYNRDIQHRKGGNESTKENSDTSSQENASPCPNTSECQELPHSSSQASLGPNEFKDNLPALLECPLCLAELQREYFPRLTNCNHVSCRDCLQQYLRIEITESRTNISCPQCPERMHPSDLGVILSDHTLIDKYEDFMVRRVLAAEPDARWCPAPDCGYAVVAAGCASCPKIRCERPGCGSFFCYHCKAEWHPNQTCDAARAQRSPHIRSSSVSFSQDSQHHDIKPCPRCQVLIVKMDDGSCNHMTCAVCGAEFCWLCMKEISDLHYLSPSGCTFWGKKPWSRKKKILWQLGTLVGAPLGIGLVAGIAVPAIVIGVPVWVGRKLHARYQQVNRHKRNLVITGGVAASILVSPVLAGLAVGIGVPILLAYVYGVVPISLCRSGGCGVTTSASGVRFAFDEDNSDGTTGKNNYDSVFDGASQHGVNPSIGEVSFGPSASLSMGSASNLDRLGRESDRESASNVAIAGASITGSIASSSLIAAGHKLEVQADIASNKRLSLTSETASVTVSFSERSAAADDGGASTRALAGSVLSYKMSDNISIKTAPVEVHIDLASEKSVEDSGASSSTSCAPLVPASPVSGFSVDEIITGNKRSSRKRLTVDRQLSENSSLMSTEDAMSERVRFDDNVSFIDSVPGTVDVATSHEQTTQSDTPKSAETKDKIKSSKKSESKSFSFSWIRLKKRAKDEKC